MFDGCMLWGVFSALSFFHIPASFLTFIFHKCETLVYPRCVACVRCCMSIRLCVRRSRCCVCASPSQFMVCLSFSSYIWWAQSKSVFLCLLVSWKCFTLRAQIDRDKTRVDCVRLLGDWDELYWCLDNHFFQSLNPGFSHLPITALWLSLCHIFTSHWP